MLVYYSKKLPTKLPPAESRWVSAAWMQTTKVVYPHQAKRA